MKNLLKPMTTFFACFAIVLVVLQVIVSNRVGMLGKKLTGLEGSIASEKLAREFLATEVASASSILAQSEKAKALGFREPVKSDILVLDKTIPVALAP